jgi:hypothetical protein
LLTAAFGTKRRTATTHQFGRYRGEADMRSRPAPTGKGAPDPKET